MGQKELLVKAMTYDYPEEIPISVGCLPATWKKYPEQLREIALEYPHYFGYMSNYTYDASTLSSTYKLGETKDEWACVWTNIEEGMEAYVTGHPIKDPQKIHSLEIPSNRDGRLPHGFMRLCQNCKKQVLL